MPTPSLPRRAAAWSALTLAGTVFLGGPAVAAPPGADGDVRIYVVGTAAAAHLNQPKVCRFYLGAVNFDLNQRITWTIAPQPATVTGTSLSGSLTLPTGTATSANLVLPGGRYRLTWTIVGVAGSGKQKVVKIDCPITPGGPNGGPPAGAGGMARTEAFTPVVGAAAVGLAATGTAVWLRLRRRSHGAA
ncbi:hypothetical protein ACH47Z_10010 [Streptomyces sp. NPDC020192]|uniref:hypothetical protein n=1 Tax=Streptomyces sp. NPDC020192 TaxID=3365066 RepID=UPI003799A666